MCAPESDDLDSGLTFKPRDHVKLYTIIANPEGNTVYGCNIRPQDEPKSLSPFQDKYDGLWKADTVTLNRLY